MSRKNRFLIILASALVIIIVAVLLNMNFQEREVNKSDMACSPNNLLGMIDFSESIAFFEGQDIIIPDLAIREEERAVLAVAREERWVEIDLSEQTLKAWEGDKLFLETRVSTGLPWWPTPKGEFRIWIKLRATKMEGGSGNYYYYLPNVPYVMYFGNDEYPNWRGYGLHGTYWHNDFGNPRSHGCVNLPTNMSKELYQWLDPMLPAGKSVVYSSKSNPGSRVVIHE